MKKILAALLFCGATMFGQTLTTAIEEGGPPRNGWVILNKYNVSNKLIYQCSALSRGRSTSWTIGSTLTSIVVASDVGTVNTVSAHGLWQGARVVVAGSGVTAANKEYKVVSVTSSTAFTIATSGVSDQTLTTAKMTVTTYDPTENDTAWVITVIKYDTNGLFETSYVAKPNVSTENVVSGNLKCADRALY